MHDIKREPGDCGTGKKITVRLNALYRAREPEAERKRGQKPHVKRRPRGGDKNPRKGAPWSGRHAFHRVPTGRTASVLAREEGAGLRNTRKKAKERSLAGAAKRNSSKRETQKTERVKGRAARISGGKGHCCRKNGCQRSTRPVQR